MSPFGLLDRLLAPHSPQQRTRWLARATYAHRGLHGDGRVENSPSAFDAAIAAGLGIECDVQCSRDGEAVVFHDWELDRLTEANGPVRLLDAEDLTRIRLRGSEDRIPRLTDLLDRVRGRVPLLIEIKSRRDRPFAALCFAVQRAVAAYDGSAAVMSFDPRVARWFARAAPDVIRGLVITEERKRGARGIWQRHYALWHARPEFLAYDVRDLPSAFAATQRRRGLPLLTWTVRTPELRERAIPLADALIVEGMGLP